MREAQVVETFEVGGGTVYVVEAPDPPFAVHEVVSLQGRQGSIVKMQHGLGEQGIMIKFREPNRGYIFAPWTAEQVASLNRFQTDGCFHEFTCGAVHEGHRTLVATTTGWVCSDPACTYTQDWAHEFMTRM